MEGSRGLQHVSVLGTGATAEKFMEMNFHLQVNHPLLFCLLLTKAKWGLPGSDVYQTTCVTLLPLQQMVAVATDPQCAVQHEHSTCLSVPVCVDFLQLVLLAVVCVHHLPLRHESIKDSSDLARTYNKGHSLSKFISSACVGHHENAGGAA